MKSVSSWPSTSASYPLLQLHWGSFLGQTAVMLYFYYIVFFTLNSLDVRTYMFTNT